MTAQSKNTHKKWYSVVNNPIPIWPIGAGEHHRPLLECTVRCTATLLKLLSQWLHFRCATNKCSLTAVIYHPWFFLLQSLNGQFIAIFAKFSKFHWRRTHRRCRSDYCFVGMFLYYNLLNVYVNGLDVYYCSCLTGCSILKWTFSREGASPLVSPHPLLYFHPDAF